MLTFTEFSGSPYHAGLALGKFGARAVHDRLIKTALWESVMQWRGMDQIHAMQQLVQDHHPYIWDEIQGLARGLELPPEDVFVWNCRTDLPLFPTGDVSPDAEETQEPTPGKYSEPDPDANDHATDASTTTMALTPEGPRITHDQYGIPGFEDQCAIAEFTIDQGPNFASFICPGSLPGNTFAVNDKGLAITVNAGVAQDPVPGMPSAVLTRALLNAPDLSTAVQLLNDSPRCGSMHLALTQCGGSALLSVGSDAAEVSVRAVRETTIHDTCSLHGSMHEQAGPASSLHVVARTDIHAHADAVSWDIYEHPDEPARFRMRDAKHI